MSSPVNPFTSVSAILIETVIKELDLSPEQLHQKREEMTAGLEKCLSDYFSPEKGLKADPTDDDPNPNHALPDSLFMRDLATQIWTANNGFFIETVHSCLVEAGMEEEAQDYKEIVRAAIETGVEIESMKIWGLITIHYQMLKQMCDMRFVKTSAASFEPPSPEDLFPTPQPDWKANHGNNNPGPCHQDLNQSNLVQHEAGIAAEIESTLTPMEDTYYPAGLVHNGEVAAESMIDEAESMIDAEAEQMIDAEAEETQKDMKEVMENLEISSDGY